MPPSRFGKAAWLALGAVVVVVVGSLVFFRHTGAPNSAASAPTAKPGVTAATPAGSPAAANTMLSWDPAKDGDPKTYAIDGLSLTLSTRPQATGGPIQVLRVTAPDARTFEQPGQQGEGAPAYFAVGRLDPAGEGEQVIFATYTGGAHCCEDIVVLELAPGGWRALDVGQFQGDNPRDFPKDVDGDGAPDLVLEDDNFAYAFASYAQSFMPPKIFNVVHGAVVDVSSSGRYGGVYRQDMKAAQADCANHNNGACAAFVADASRLGMHDWAWSIMLADYDRAAQWIWPTQCRIAVGSGDCPKDQQLSFTNFPDALQAFLVQFGYVAAGAPQVAATGGGPSFDCAGAASAVLRLICETPALAQADRDLSGAYARAMARAPEPARLRDEQRRWITRRDAVPARRDILGALYAQRIKMLRAEGGG